MKVSSLSALVCAASFCAAIWTENRIRSEAVDRARLPENRPIEVSADGFVSSRTCKSCHPSEYDAWFHSYHRKMTQVASPETVIGDFDDVEVEHEGRRFHLYRSGERFWIDPLTHEGSEEAGKPRPVVMTTGSHHYQGYWFPRGGGRRVNFFRFLYRIDEQRWIPLDAAFLLPPGTDTAACWNEVCIKCHSTGAEPRIDAKEMDTHVAEFGIACEACHGPAQEHVDSNRNPLRRFAQRQADEPDPTIVNPADLDAVRASDVCGQCHSITAFQSVEQRDRWDWEGFEYRAGDLLADSREFETSGEHYFWPDGMPRVNGREYNSLLNTPCFQHGDGERGVLSCLSCHEMHQKPGDSRTPLEWADDQLKPDMRSGNHACTQCHAEYLDEAVLAAHTHHAPSSSGSECYNCHMPNTTYGLLKATRSHQIDSPTVEAGLLSGRPNACNLCHLDRTLSWTAAELARHYGQPAAETLRGGRGLTPDEREVPASILWMLSGDACQRAIVAWSYGWEPARAASGSHWMPPFLAPLMEDPYHAVRFIARKSLRADPMFSELEFDFMGPPQERMRARQLAHRTWLQSSSTDLRAPGPAGSWSELSPLVERLLADRDDRPIFLKE